MTIRLYINDLSPIGVMVQSKAKSTGSKQLSDICTGVQALSYSENEWSSPVKDSLSPKLTKNLIGWNIHLVTTKLGITIKGGKTKKRSYMIQQRRIENY